MARPKKIKKKKSFMFTSRHQSELAIMSLVLGIASLASMISSVIISYACRGETALRLGGVGLFAVISNLVGTVGGCMSLRERDIFLWLPRTALVVNGLTFALWMLLIIMGVRGV